MKTLIAGGRVIDPANRVDAKLNLLVENGKIAWVGVGTPSSDRVLGSGSSLTGYTGGLHIKIWLLTHEGCPFR